jgi:hypothetical protein
VIEPTDEMRTAFRAEREDSCDEIGCGRDDCLNERLAAVLAIVARDYAIRPRRSPPTEDPCCGVSRHGRKCELPPGHWGNHGRGVWEAWG